MRRAFLAVLLLVGCGDNAGPSQPSQCDPLEGQREDLPDTCVGTPAFSARCEGALLQRCEGELWVTVADCREVGQMCATPGDLAVCTNPTCRDVDQARSACFGTGFNAGDYVMCTEALETCTLDDRRHLADYHECIDSACADGQVANQGGMESCTRAFYDKLTPPCHEALATF